MDVTKKKILFLNSVDKECGIYQFGLNIAKVITSYNFKYITASYSELVDMGSLNQDINRIHPDIIILNYVHLKHHWLLSCNINTPIIFIDIIHEKPEYVNYRQNNVFKSHIIATPSIDGLGLDSSFFSLPRLLPEFNTETYIEQSIPSIGCFSFGIIDRGWIQAIDIANRDFTKAVIKFHMPFNRIVDPDGKIHALKTAEICRNRYLKNGITLEIDHTFLPAEEVVRKLGQNTINIFLYHPKENKGVSSSIDFALAAKRPIAINSSPMYSHLSSIEPLINVEKNTLLDIIKRGTTILEPFYLKWNKDSFCQSFETTITNIILRYGVKLNYFNSTSLS